MATDDAPRRDDGFSDSDRQWFDRLSGKPGPYTDEQAVREADALRLALQREQQALDADPELAAATTPQALQRGLQALHERAVREGLLPRSGPAPAWRRWLAAIGLAGHGAAGGWRGRAPAAIGLAAVVALGVVLVPSWNGDDDYGSPPVLRGADGVHHQRVERPREAAEALAASLREAGLKPGVYRRGTTYVVDFDVEPHQLAAAAPAFARAAIEPAPGFTRIEYEPR